MQTLYTSFANLAAVGNTASAVQASMFSSVGAFMGTGVTFGAGTLKAQVSFDGGTTWLDVPNASFTAATANMKKADYSVIGPLMRWNLAGATGPSLDLRQASRAVRHARTQMYTFSADGAYTFTVPSTGVDIAYAAQGTWGAGTLTYEVSPDGGTTWFLQEAGLTANGIRHIAAVDNKETLARIKLTGSTSPSLTAWVVL